MNNPALLKDYGQAVIEKLKANADLEKAVAFYNPPKDWLVEFFFTEIAIAFNSSKTIEEAAKVIYVEFLETAQAVLKTQGVN